MSSLTAAKHFGSGHGGMERLLKCFTAVPEPTASDSTMATDVVEKLRRLYGEPTGVFDDIFDSLGGRHDGCAIPDSADRAITLRQLRAVHAHVQRRCVAEGWRNGHGERLTPERVLLYDASTYVIKPSASAGLDPSTLGPSV